MHLQCIDYYSVDSVFNYTLYAVHVFIFQAYCMHNKCRCLHITKNSRQKACNVHAYSQRILRILRKARAHSMNMWNLLCKVHAHTSLRTHGKYCLHMCMPHAQACKLTLKQLEEAHWIEINTHEFTASSSTYIIANSVTCPALASWLAR